jgi:hypothetical protein
VTQVLSRLFITNKNLHKQFESCLRNVKRTVFMRNEMPPPERVSGWRLEKLLAGECGKSNNPI